MSLLLIAPFCWVSQSAASSPSGKAVSKHATTYRSWVQQMKAASKGPFSRIRWYCNDGSVLPPKAYACSERGGGIQHGELNDRAQRMRAAGYEIANVLAALEAEDFVGDSPDVEALTQILVERFLIEMDNGWIFRGARTYRGALQAEDETAASEQLLLTMLGDGRWRDPSRFLLLRETARLLPQDSDADLAAEVRSLSLQIAERDAAFNPLRIKIHGFPDAGDAKSVRDYAKSRGKAALAADYQKLASDIDTLYNTSNAGPALERLAKASRDAAWAKSLRSAATRLTNEPKPEVRFGIAAQLATDLRNRMQIETDPKRALETLRTSLVVMQEAFASGNMLVARIGKATRSRRLEWIGDAANALYGVGFITRRHLEGIGESLAALQKAKQPSVQIYRDELRYLARAAEWSSRSLEYHFGYSMDHLYAIEPKARLYSQDRMRGSPLLVYGSLTDGLIRDANRVAGIEHELFGKRVGAGLRALNPGLVQGKLYSKAKSQGFTDDGIYLLPETISDLPPVAGILTRGEGNSLSHVQLLARNLGIPNVVVGEEHIAKLESRHGKQVVMAVSANGVVQLDTFDNQWAKVFGRESMGDALVIRPDLQKLDLTELRMVPLSDLRATDSGRVSGPKGANLGELKHHYGDMVPKGFVIPFGSFRKLLDQPLEPGGPSVFEWMKSNYAQLEGLEGTAKERATKAFLERLRSWISNCDPGPEFRKELRSTLAKQFGKDGSYGVFVRSDTNVEDLPGFTGAGLNLTVANAVGFDAIYTAVRKVWASPFTERAFGWRQSHMEQPEYVFPAVVVQYSFPADKSGVMVTADVDTGSRDWLSVAVNEGVGGAVDGQAAEALKIHLKSGDVQFLAQATAAKRRTLSPRGGIGQVAASGTDAVLTSGEINQLIKLARQVPKRFPSLQDAEGGMAAADIEFAFRNGKLALLQMRPFVESRGAKMSRYLMELDAGLAKRANQRVRLDQIPKD